jgi:hypothetical protein
MRALARFILLTTLMISVFGCASLIRHDGDYRGRVVDADTQQPLEGVVVLGTWSELHPNLAGGSHTFYDARETVTDRNGDFSIPGQGLLFFSNIEPMSVMIFKSGYSCIDSVAWPSLTLSSYYRDRIKWEGDKAIFPLKRLTLEERKRQGSPSRPSAPIERMKLMTEEISKDRVERGLDKLF